MLACLLRMKSRGCSGESLILLCLHTAAVSSAIKPIHQDIVANATTANTVHGSLVSSSLALCITHSFYSIQICPLLSILSQAYPEFIKVQNHNNHYLLF